MNKNSETRIECTDWDGEVPVATWAMGRGRMPARKVITRGVAKVELTARQAGSIVGKLAAGMEAHDLVRVKTRDWSRSDTVTMTKEK